MKYKLLSLIALLYNAPTNPSDQKKTTPVHLQFFQAVRSDAGHFHRLMLGCCNPHTHTTNDDGSSNSDDETSNSSTDQLPQLSAEQYAAWLLYYQNRFFYTSSFYPLVITDRTTAQDNAQPAVIELSDDSNNNNDSYSATTQQQAIATARSSTDSNNQPPKTPTGMGTKKSSFDLCEDNTLIMESEEANSIPENENLTAEAQAEATAQKYLEQARAALTRSNQPDHQPQPKVKNGWWF